ncbi:MAG: PIG-L family deacetylase [Methyloprofundus sp.]|nr:PIG-L family deacetylase [Methyloprofundus sp.]
MTDSLLIVAPHPDDEVLGCGGLIHRAVAQGKQVHWLIITHMSDAQGFLPAKIAKREVEIQAIAQQVGFTSVHNLAFPVAQLDALPLSDIVTKIADVINKVQPSSIYLPFRGDAHSDHKVVFDACVPFTKSFRYPFVKSVRVYETLSETDFGIRPDGVRFCPNVFVDISDFMEAKIATMHVYESEIGAPPFPRSEEAIRSLATLRGSVAGCLYAEAFMSLKEVE